MPSNPELYLMTQLLNLEGMKVIDYRIIVNRRLFRCSHCQKKFTEDLGFVKRKRNHTKRFVERIIEEVLTSDIFDVAKRNDLSEQEIETML